MKTLLLNSTEEPLAFITEKKCFKLLYKEKAEVKEFWNELTNHPFIEKFPAIIKLKTYIRRNYFKASVFNRRLLVKRDESTCQFCGLKLLPKEVTIDHLVPRSLGGQTNFINCVVSCSKCNCLKGSLTLEKSGLSLIRKPFNPNFSNLIIKPEDHWHETWDDYLI